MLLRYYLIPVFIFITLSSNVVYSLSEYKPNDPNAVEFVSPEKIMLQYYEAVDRGELVVFGIQMKRSMLIPVHVDYVYPLNSQIPRIKVYAELKKPIQIPQQGNNMFKAVCAVIDMFGVIVEAEAHIFLK